MRATTIHGVRDVRLTDEPDPTIQEATDAIVRVVAGCVCGSDLWDYRGDNQITAGSTIGHECIGVVEEVGGEVRNVAAGDFVVVPFDHCDNTCPHCLAGMHAACDNLGFTVSGQAELARVTQADGSLVRTSGTPDDAALPALLALADVMPTGWHAAVSARVRPGSTVVVVGDGAVGLCGVLAASTMGAGRVIAMSRHEPRQEIARRFGATDVVAERGKEGAAVVAELTGGVGADAVLECVGTDESMKTALRCARPGASVGYVGVPHGVNIPINVLFARNIGLAGGMAPVRRYLPELLALVEAGELDPSPVFDLTLPLDEVAEAYAAMDERRAVKVMLRP
jgi:threonine dehydrogenase-like Zn-dependent dehydrogenase